MCLTELYSAMVETEADELAANRRYRQMTRPAAAPSPREIRQESHIRMLERENLRLKGAFASLVHVLVQKNLMDEKDLQQLLLESRKATNATLH